MAGAVSEQSRLGGAWESVDSSVALEHGSVMLAVGGKSSAVRLAAWRPLLLALLLLCSPTPSLKAPSVAAPHPPDTPCGASRGLHPPLEGRCITSGHPKCGRGVEGSRTDEQREQEADGVTEWWQSERVWVRKARAKGPRCRPASDKLREAAARCLQHVFRRTRTHWPDGWRRGLDRPAVMRPVETRVCCHGQNLAGLGDFAQQAGVAADFLR
eukprot:2292871-Prymnesium_polylepis.1